MFALAPPVAPLAQKGLRTPVLQLAGSCDWLDWLHPWGGLQLPPPPNFSPLPSPPSCVPPKGWGETAGVCGLPLGDTVIFWVLLCSGGETGHPYGADLCVNRIWSQCGAGGGGEE